MFACCLLATLALAGRAMAQGDLARSRWQLIHERPGVSLRALAVVDDSTIWAGGSGGTILRSTDGGATFESRAPVDSGELDFRDLHAFDGDKAVAMVAGQPARLYRTTDGGVSWQVVHTEADPAAFFDSIHFAGEHGLLFGDPLGAAAYVAATDDGGRSWRRLESLPMPIVGEAGFAASGSCIAAVGAFRYVVTGGTASRCFVSADAGRNWFARRLPLAQGAASKGAFSVAFRGNHGVVVGGDYQAPAEANGTAAHTMDAGRTWQATSAGGYRSGVVWLDDDRLLAVGSDGASWSADRGRTWEPFGNVGFHVIGCGDDGSVFAAGSDGRIARLVATPEFRVMPLFGDHMVLPPEEAVLVRGTGGPGQRVAINTSWGFETACTIADDGRWRAVVVTPAAGRVQKVTLRSGAERIELADVLIGDVWLCSGQSNMEMPIGHRGGWKLGIENWQQEVLNANHPQLRVFTTERATSGTPEFELEGEWHVCSPDTAGDFSAVAYFFGRDLIEAGHGPIGLVVSSWGGTVCEAWTSAPGLAEFPEFESALAATQQPEVPRAERVRQFWAKVPESVGLARAAWESVELPAPWSKSGWSSFDGVAFYRRAVELPPALRGQALRLELGAVDDMDTVWCNGTKVGGLEDAGSWATKRRYTVPAALTTGRERLELVVRVVDTGGEGGFTSTPADMVLTGVDGGVRVPLAGAWQRRRATAMADLPAWPRGGGARPNRPAVLYNAMIAPLVPFPFRGALFYQGESNRLRAEQYAKLFPAMIRDWRRVFARELPFYFVQIAPFGYRGEALGGVELRWAQAQALELPRTGMAVTLDIGDARDIHPRNKLDVGRRLALHARRACYGENVVTDGPIARRAAAFGPTLRIEFEPSRSGLRPDDELRGFEIAGADERFVPARARVEGREVVVSHPDVDAPVHVRYAWAAVPEATLFNEHGLPAGPFRLSSPR